MEGLRKEDMRLRSVAAGNESQVSLDLFANGIGKDEAADAGGAEGDYSLVESPCCGEGTNKNIRVEKEAGTRRDCHRT